MPPSQRLEAHRLLQSIFKKIGNNTWFEFPFNCDYGCLIEIGNNCYFNHHFSIGDGGRVIIGDNVLIGPYSGIYTTNHPLNATERKAGWQQSKNVTIGNNVWIGANVTILPGVQIGDNVVIGAGSVVTKNIKDNTLAYGNPCREIKSIE